MEVLHGTRFGMFAAAHILWSILCSPIVPRLLGGELFPACAAAAAMMLTYLILGWGVARFGHWPVPTKNQSLWAVFFPAGIAWAWAGTTAICLALPGDAIAVAAVLGIPAFLLASPSLLFVMAFLGFAWKFCYSMGFYNETPIMGIAIFFAGLLPPLLFWLGSCFGAEKETIEKKEPETA